MAIGALAVACRADDLPHGVCSAQVACHLAAWVLPQQFEDRLGLWIVCYPQSIVTGRLGFSHELGNSLWLLVFGHRP